MIKLQQGKSNSITFLYLSILAIFLSACMTSKRGKQLQDDVFSLKTQLMQLEKQVNGTNQMLDKEGTTTNKKVASVDSKIDRMMQDIKKIKGDIDTLKVAVSLGYMPGIEQNPNSVGKKLEYLETRVEVIEEMQMKLSKKKSPPPKPKRSSSSTGSIDNLDDLESAFNAEKFDTVIANAPRIKSNESGTKKHEVSYYYAESLFMKNRFRDAALEYNEIIESSTASGSIKVKSLLRMGNCFEKLGDSVTAKIYYEELQTNYASSSEAEKAKGLIQQLDSE